MLIHAAKHTTIVGRILFNIKCALAFLAKIAVDRTILVFLLTVPCFHIAFKFNFRFVSGVFMCFET